MPLKYDRISIINRDCRIEGQLHFKGHLIVEGAVEGSLEGESIFIEKGGIITAKLHAISVTIAGLFKGEIETDILTLLKTANVDGHIRCHRLVMDEGGILNGSVKFISSNAPSQNPV